MDLILRKLLQDQRWKKIRDSEFILTMWCSNFNTVDIYASAALFRVLTIAEKEMEILEDQGYSVSEEEFVNEYDKFIELMFMIHEVSLEEAVHHPFFAIEKIIELKKFIWHMVSPYLSEIKSLKQESLSQMSEESLEILLKLTKTVLNDLMLRDLEIEMIYHREVENEGD